MTSRERVLTALDHQEPDRIPVDLGGTVVTSISALTYAEVRQSLGLPAREIRIMETVQQIAAVDEDVMEAFGVDVIPVSANPPDTPPQPVTTRPDGSVQFVDDFGATLHKPNGTYYYDWREFPLPEADIAALSRIPWPNPDDPGRWRGLRDRVQKLRASTDRALVGMAPSGHDLFNQIFRVRGMEEGLIDLLANPEFAEAFLDKLAATMMASHRHFLAAVGDLIDVFFQADDLSSQSGPLISPDTYRNMVKPRYARIFSQIKALTKAKVFYHSCGAVTEFIPDLIELGVDILNPVQVSATGMETAGLKRKWGRNLSFWGGACDTQSVLPFGTPAEVKAEARRRIRDLAPGGGLVFNPVHNIQPCVPPGNVIALFEAAGEYGRYPIT